jgi:hypothetical protein
MGGTFAWAGLRAQLTAELFVAKSGHSQRIYRVQAVFVISASRSEEKPPEAFRRFGDFSLRSAASGTSFILPVSRTLWRWLLALRGVQNLPIKVEGNYGLQAANEAHVEAATNNIGHFAEPIGRSFVRVFGAYEDVIAYATLARTERGELIIPAEITFALVEQTRGDNGQLRHTHLSKGVFRPLWRLRSKNRGIPANALPAMLD